MDQNLSSGGGNTSGLASIALPGQKLATSKNPRTLTPSEITLLQQDLKAALEREEESAAITKERQAFRRRQAAFAAVNPHFLPTGSGQPPLTLLAELDEAEAAWRKAQADVRRILEEIRSGRRR
jgi:hypothetical protein